LYVLIKKHTNTEKENRMPQATPLNDFVVAGLGIATVFLSLICIILICNIMGAIFKNISDKPSYEKKSNGSGTVKNAPIPSPSTSDASCVPQAATEEYVPATIEDRGAFIAAVSAAIAEDCGADVSRIRILSVRERANSIPDRAKICAAISAVISAETGAEHVRIHSIRRLSSIPDREKLCAAVSAVISAETGAEHVRIHSIKRV